MQTRNQRPRQDGGEQTGISLFGASHKKEARDDDAVRVARAEIPVTKGNLGSSFEDSNFQWNCCNQSYVVLAYFVRDSRRLCV